jgi:hypothetical protein
VLIPRRSPEGLARQCPAWSALWLAMRVWLGRDCLDRELAEGANPDTDPARRLRARQLSSRRTRRHVAGRLRWLIAEARQPTHSTWAVVPPLNHRQLEEAGESLLMLADRLEQVPKPCPRALALASFLIHDPSSPAFMRFQNSRPPSSSGNGATVTGHARAALEAIDQQPNEVTRR